MTIVLPCFNEQDHVVAEVERICKAMDDSEHTYELMAIDDKSSDATLTRLLEARVRFPTCASRQDEDRRVRLYLSSFRLGDHPERLLGLLRGQGRTLVVANACDDASTEERAAAVALELDALTRLGLADVEELDLREHLDGRLPERLRRRLAGAELLWVRGGNVFALRHALAASGADVLVKDLLHKDALVYAGYSAGPCVLAPSLWGLERCDDPGAVRRAYGASARYDGLGVLAEAFVPHIDSRGHPESRLLGQVAARYRADGVPHRTLRDGQALVVDGGLVELV